MIELDKVSDAAVISAGYAGRDPDRVCQQGGSYKKFGTSSKAFIITPLVGPFVGGISNAFIIALMLDLIV